MMRNIFCKSLGLILILGICHTQDTPKKDVLPIENSSDTGFQVNNDLDKHYSNQKTVFKYLTKKTSERKSRRTSLSPINLSEDAKTSHTLEKKLINNNPETKRMIELMDANDGIDDPIQEHEESPETSQYEQYLMDIIGDHRTLERKNIFADILNESVYQIAYSISNPIQMASFLITNAFWSAKTFFGYSASATSLISQNFRVLPSYLNEEQKETVSIETNALISQYNADIIQNEAYLNKLGVTNFKPIAGQIINEYDGTQDIFTMLINNENFKSLIKDSELSETDILRSAEAIEVILNDLIDIKLHGRYSIALYEFKKEFHQSNNFIASYNAFYNEAASRHQLSGKDYTLMMKFFINSLYQKSIATGSMRETYTLSRNIAGPALDDTYVKRAYDKHFNKIMASLKTEQEASDLIYEAVKYDTANDMLKNILNSGTFIGRLARYSAMTIQFITTYAIFGGAVTAGIIGGAAVGVVGAAGSYLLSTAKVSKKVIQEDEIFKKLQTLADESKTWHEDSQFYTEDSNAKTIQKITDRLNAYQKSHTFSLTKDIWGAFVEKNKYKLEALHNSRAIIAVKPTVMHEAVSAEFSKRLTQQENIDDIARSFRRNFNISEESKKHDTFLEKANKVFNKYLDVILSFATGMELFKPISTKEKELFITEYINTSVDVFKTAVYNNFYEAFKKEYARSNTSLDECFYNYWDSNKSAFIERMYFERFNIEITYPKDKTSDEFKKCEQILEDECFSYIKKELYRELTVKKDAELLSINKYTHKKSSEYIDLDDDKVSRIRALNPTPISY